MNPAELSAAIKKEALARGFAACGVMRPGPLPSATRLDEWLERGYHGEMGYMARQAHVRRDPTKAWDKVRSIVVVLCNYYSAARSTEPEYSVSKYAQAEDYHGVIRMRLDALARAIQAMAGGSFRSYVDAGPLPERDLAQQAGLGWIGKNTMLIRPGLGSFTFIGSLLTDLDLEPDAPFEADRCGTCTRCLDACPTDAFVEARRLDARRCISYLTIESRSEIPAGFHAGIGEHLFGCDVCQDVCPWNHRFASETDEPAFRPDAARAWPTLEELMTMDEVAFDERFGDTAIERTGAAGLRRNARVVAANRQAGDSVITVSSGGQRQRNGTPDAPTPRLT